MRSVLEDVVRLGGLALQAEDCSIRAAVHHRDERGGLVRMENERHHQFIIWRAILPIWHAVLEREDGTDIIISRDGTNHYFELKNWRGAGGGQQIPAIRRDVSRLQSRENGYLLITSGNPRNPRDQTDENIKWLLSEVSGIDDNQREVYRFVTENEKGAVVDYWIAGWPLQKSAGLEAMLDVTT